MSFVYTPFKARVLSGDVDMSGSGVQTFKVALLMANTTADTDQDAGTLSAIGTLDEYDGANYVRKTLASPVVNQDDPNNRGEFAATNLTWTALGAGTRQAQGMLLYQHVDGTNANDRPIAWIDAGGFPFAGNGGDVAVTWNSEGILQAT